MVFLHVFSGVLFSIAASLPSPAAQSQITTAVIDGTVIDASGAVLPGVAVEIRNTDTNLVRELTTDRDGRFVALQLPPGRYTVTLKLQGFATLVMEDVRATVGEAVHLAPQMKLSNVARNGHGEHAGADDRADADGRPRRRSTRRRSPRRRFSAASSRIC